MRGTLRAGHNQGTRLERQGDIEEVGRLFECVGTMRDDHTDYFGVFLQGLTLATEGNQIFQADGVAGFL